MGRQLLREPLTPVSHRRFWSLYALLKPGLALRQRHYIRITNVIFPRKSSFFFSPPHCSHVEKSPLSDKEGTMGSFKAIGWCLTSHSV